MQDLISEAERSKAEHAEAKLSEAERWRRIAVIGRGRAGGALARAIEASESYELTQHAGAREVAAGNATIAESDVLIVASSDAHIGEVSEAAVRRTSGGLKLVVHLAGSQSPFLLAGRNSVGAALARLTLHPIQTITGTPRPDSESELNGIYWMASSESAQAVEWAREFTHSLGAAGLIVLPESALPLYHAMAVFGANFLVLLGAAIEKMSGAIGQDPVVMKAALAPLMRQALENVLADSARNVLTGPIARDDRETIARHQQALTALDPKLRTIYDAFLDFARSE